MSKLYVPKLTNAQEMAKLNPDSFFAPSSTELKNIGERDYVKVSDGKDRFWVGVETLEGDLIIGIIANPLTGDQRYNFRDRIKFNKNNIYEITKKDNTKTTTKDIVVLRDSKTNGLQ